MSQALCVNKSNPLYSPKGIIMTEFRLATEADTDAIRALWSYSFEKPGEPFFDWYFSKCYEPYHVILGTTNGNISCALHYRIRSLALRETTILAGYLLGVTTHPAARGRGLAKELLHFTLHNPMINFPLFLLMPSSATLYRHMGFGFCDHHWEREATPRDIAPLAETPHRVMMISDAAEWPRLATLYHQCVRNVGASIKRNEQQWISIMEETLLEGHIAVVCDEKNPLGYLLYRIQGNRLTASEFVYTSERGRRMLYGYLAAHAGQVETCRWYEPFFDSSYLYFANGAEHTYIQNRPFPFLMARLKDPESAFSGIPVDWPETDSVTLTLEDPFLPEMAGNYRLSVENGKTSMKKMRGKKTDFTIDAEGAVQLLFGTVSPEELIRTEKIRGAKRNATDFLSYFFPKENIWINEWF